MLQQGSYLGYLILIRDCVGGFLSLEYKSDSILAGAEDEVRGFMKNAFFCSGFVGSWMEIFSTSIFWMVKRSSAGVCSLAAKNP